MTLTSYMLGILRMVAGKKKIPFRSGEALRKQGYLTRITTEVWRNSIWDEKGELVLEEDYIEHVWALTGQGKEVVENAEQAKTPAG